MLKWNNVETKHLRKTRELATYCGLCFHYWNKNPLYFESAPDLRTRASEGSLLWIVVSMLNSYDLNSYFNFCGCVFQYVQDALQHLRQLLQRCCGLLFQQWNQNPQYVASSLVQHWLISTLKIRIRNTLQALQTSGSAQARARFCETRKKLSPRSARPRAGLASQMDTRARWHVEEGGGGAHTATV